MHVISHWVEKSRNSTMDKTGNVLLDIESLTQSLEKCCSGSPKMTKALSRKGSSRMDRRPNEEQEADDATEKNVPKVIPSQLEFLKQPLVSSKTLVAPSPVLTDSGEVRNKRFSRLRMIHPRKVLLLFATVSSMGTMILIYFTLSINRKSGA